MKKMKKLMALLVAMVMAIAMGVAVSAAGEGKLTVKNSDAGVTYNFYKIFDLTGQDTSDPADNKYDAVTYTMDADWADFFIGDTAPGKAYIVDTNSGNLNAININGATKYINITNSNRVAFTNAAMKYAIDNNLTVDKTATGVASGDVTVTGLDLGYYLMVPVDMTDEKTNPLTTGTIASLTSTIPEGEIYVKGTKPGVEKKDNVISAEIGQTVTYTLTGKMPNTSGTASYIYKLQDEMTAGLTFNKDEAVTIEGVTAPITSQCTIDYTSVTNGFVCTIPVANLQGENGANIGKTITLTYTATVNEKAIQTTNEKNKVKVIYGRNPNKLEESVPVEEELYSANIKIVKYTGDSAEQGTKLANAKFALMNSEGKYYKYTPASGTPGEAAYVPAKVEWLTVANAPTSGTADVTDAQAQVLAAATDTITTVTTDSKGEGSFDGLADGTYYLVEFAAPDGYNRLSTPQKVEVKGKNVDTTEMENVAQAGQTEFDEAIDATANVQNQSGTPLPSTGGMGTTILYILGTILVLGAGLTLITKRRMSAK